jgi:hypothetical protein
MRPADDEGTGPDLIGEFVAQGLPRPLAAQLVSHLDQIITPGMTRAEAKAKCDEFVREVVDRRFGPDQT